MEWMVDNGHVTETPSPRQATWRLIALLLLAYVVLGRLTFAASVEYGNVTSVVFAPEGVALVFCILFGPRVAPGIVLGQALLSYWSGPSILGGVCIGAINALECSLGGYLFHRWRISRRLDRLRDVWLFTALVFLILQPISATGGVLVLAGIHAASTELAHIMPDSIGWIHGIQKPLPSLASVPTAWMHWWLGNSLGQLLVSPLLLAWLSPKLRKHDPLRASELACIAAGVCGVVLLAYSDLPSSELLMLVLSYMLLVWMGLLRGIRAVTVANLLIAGLLVWMGVHGRGFMSYLSVPDRLFYVGLFIVAGSFFSLALSALLEERRDLIQRLTELASKDPLTQVGNRRHFMTVAERELTKAQRDGHPVSLALLDVDHFKAVNDRHGHVAGDLALQAFARCCEAALRPGDLLGRTGGEEFALLFPHAATQEAVQIIERLRRSLALQSIRASDGTAIRLTFSAGIAEATAQASLSDIYRAADSAMYRAKHAGRDRTVTAGAGDWSP